VKLNPDSAEPRLLLANLQLRAGTPDLAIEEAQEILKRNPKSPQAHLILSNAYLQKKDILKAAKAIDDFIQISPSNAIGYYEKGRILLIQKKEKERWINWRRPCRFSPIFWTPST